MSDFVADMRQQAMANLTHPVIVMEVQRAARRLKKSREDAQDLMQDTFVEAMTNADAYDADRGTPVAWLKCIARTRSIDHFRREQARTRFESFLVVTTDVFSEQPPYAERLQDHELVHDAMLSLPPEQLCVLRLLHYEGLTTQQVAERTNVSVGTVKTRLRLGRQKLGRLLQDLR